MNRQLNRLALVAILLLVALVVATTYWQTWATAGLADRQDNAIRRVAQFEIRRGLIEGPGGSTVYARNRTQHAKGQQTLYLRHYPTNGLAAQVVGYSTPGHAQAGLERSENAWLTGSKTDLSGLVKQAVDSFTGETRTGDNLVLTLDAKAQKIALDDLAGRCGAVSALDPRTGKVLVMASSPTYNPNAIDKPGYLTKLSRPDPNCPGIPNPSPLLNRATAGLFTPGSTFKVVTVSAALDTGRLTPDSPFYDPGYCTEYGKQISNAGNPDQGREVFGHVTLAEGLKYSINSVFCNVGMQLGAATILDYARRFGFYSVPPLETPTDERVASGLYDHGSLFRDASKVDPGRLAFGQERLQVTPLQMAMVAGGIANHGIVMQPYVVARITDSNGKTVSRTRPHVYRHAVKPGTAAEVAAMMVSVVQGGTGTAAQIPGVQVAGKTGTAETGIPGVNTVWFIAFAPAEAPRVAVSVVVERQRGYGGSISAPIAKDVIQALLKRG